MIVRETLTLKDSFRLIEKVTRDHAQLHDFSEVLSVYCVVSMQDLPLSEALSCFDLFIAVSNEGGQVEVVKLIGLDELSNCFKTRQLIFKVVHDQARVLIE